MIPSDLTSALNAVTKGFTTPGNDPFDAFDDEDDAAEAAESGATKVRFPKKEKEGIADTLSQRRHCRTSIRHWPMPRAKLTRPPTRLLIRYPVGPSIQPRCRAGQRPNLPGER